MISKKLSYSMANAMIEMFPKFSMAWKNKYINLFWASRKPLKKKMGR